MIYGLHSNIKQLRIYYISCSAAFLKPLAAKYSTNEKTNIFKVRGIKEDKVSSN